MVQAQPPNAKRKLVANKVIINNGTIRVRLAQASQAAVSEKERRIRFRLMSFLDSVLAEGW